MATLIRQEWIDPRLHERGSRVAVSIGIDGVHTMTAPIRIARGMVGIASGWHDAIFTNLKLSHPSMLRSDESMY